VGIGETLAEDRRQSGLTITQVSERTRIRESIIRAIEQGDFSACGGDFYARGHIRSIAGVVGADPAPLIREYDEEHGPPGGSMSAAEVFEPSTPIKIRERRSFGLGKIMIVVLLAVIGYGAYHVVSTRTSGHAPAGAQRPTAHVAVRSAATASPSATATSPALTDNVVIKLTASQDCWVLLTRANGSQIFSGVMAAGNSMSWTERRGVHLRLGNPDGVVLSLNGTAQKPASSNPVTLSISPGKKVSVVG
jgi:cytoskeletal protein RodZ